ncbi:MAG: hypothetical protein QOJ42_1336 [Acidobacteriaceae bacterium]|jgi:hypothetical protein|nr:hypothetical protein [Acidobacteriaceae bacterium]
MLFLLRHCDWFPNIAVIPDTKQGRPFSEVLSPFAQAEIVRDPEQRSTYSHLVFIAWRINNHYTGRYQAKARREMWFCPSPDNSPMGAAQRQGKINRWRTEQNSSELSPGNENRRVAGCHLLAYLERNQIRTANRQRTCFDMRPCYYFFNQVTQFSIIAVVSALNVEWATDCDRSLTPPSWEDGRNRDNSFCAFVSMHMLYSFSQLSRMISTKSNIDG